MDNSIFIFSLSSCKCCKEAMDLFDRYDIPYDFTNVDLLGKQQQQSILEDLKREGTPTSFPAIVIGDKVIEGYKKKEILEALKVQKLIKKKLFKTIWARLAIL